MGTAILPGPAAYALGRLAQKLAGVIRSGGEAVARLPGLVASRVGDAVGAARGAGRAGDAVGAARAGGAGRRTIVIGEDMAGRVIPEARRTGADYYDPPYLPPSQRMPHNRRWINDRMDEGCRIIDCGPAPGRRNYPNPTSPYYQMELDEIARRDYPWYVPPARGG